MSRATDRAQFQGETYETTDPPEWESAMADHYRAVEVAAAEWRAKWPNHCKACRGWGGSSYEESHGFKGGGTETIMDPCGAHEDLTICHRCGANGLNEHGEGPCTACGWNCDDGEPTP